MSEGTCREEVCCPQVLTYRGDANPGSNVPDTECPVPSVAFNPVDGSFVIFPTLVAIACNVAGAVIYYTLDGSDPTEESELYSGPFTVESQSETVKARAFLAGCDPGPIGMASYFNSGYQFTYLCDTGDKVGVFNEFAANGEANDYQFVLQFTPSTTIEILDITILQTTSTGFWDSGQSWSTKEWIYPYPDPAVPFHTYPLVLIDQSGPTQLFSAYQTTLGSYSAIAREWRMWGQPRTPLNGYFQLTITLGDGTKIQRLINTTCGDVPVVCPPPSAPTGVASPNSVSLIFTVAPSSQWQLFRRSYCDAAPDWVQLSDGVADISGIVELTDTTVQTCCNYDYFVTNGCGDGFVDGPVSQVFVVPCETLDFIESFETLGGNSGSSFPSDYRGGFTFTIEEALEVVELGAWVRADAMGGTVTIELRQQAGCVILATGSVAVSGSDNYVWAVLANSVTIPPGGYYLMQSREGGGNFAQTPIVSTVGLCGNQVTANSIGCQLNPEGSPHGPPNFRYIET